MHASYACADLVNRTAPEPVRAHWFHTLSSTCTRVMQQYDSIRTSEVQHDPISMPDEMHHTLALAWPLVVSYLLQSLGPIVCIALVGQIGSQELAGAGLGNLYANITGYGPSRASSTPHANQLSYHTESPTHTPMSATRCAQPGHRLRVGHCLGHVVRAGLWRWCEDDGRVALPESCTHPIHHHGADHHGLVLR